VHNAWCATGETKIQGFSSDGYFAEYAVVDAREVIILPENRQSNLIESEN
jgi:propanol-preferring alcohol dehydrogenase